MADSSFGIYGSTTNRCPNSHGLTNLSGWSTSNTLTRQADSKYGTCFKVVSVDGFTNLAAIAMSGGSKAQGAQWAGRFAFRGEGSTIGKTIRLLWWEEGGASGPEMAGYKDMVITGEWQELKDAIATIVKADRTGLSLYVQIFSAAIGDTIYFTAVQGEQGSKSTPWVRTDGAAQFIDSGYMAAPAALIDETQAWIAARLRMGWPHNHPSMVFVPRMWAWSGFGDADGWMGVHFGDDGTPGRVKIDRQEPTADGGTRVSAAQNVTWARDDLLTIIGAWTASEVKISVNGAPFTVASQGANVIPAISDNIFSIGNENGVVHSDCDFLWFACGKGVLTDVNAALIHGFGNTDKRKADFPGLCTGFFPMDTAGYEV